MSEFQQARFIAGPPRRASWLQRTVVAVVGITIAVTAFFFIAIALVAGAFLALGIGARWWWITRKMRARAKSSEALEGEYRVVERTPIEGPRVDR